MNLRALICISLCFFIQHVCAMHRDGLERYKGELRVLHTVVVDGHKTLEERLAAITQAREIIQTIKEYKDNFNSIALKDIIWGEIVILGNGFGEVNSKLASIVADLQRIEERLRKESDDAFISCIDGLDREGDRLARIILARRSR